VKIPGAFATAGSDQTVSPAAIESAFVTANPGLSPAGMAAVCEDGHFTELRICLDKDLNFRRCVEVDRSSCRSSEVLVPGGQ
jgi:ribonuclease T2